MVLFETHPTTSANKTIAGFYNKNAMNPAKYVKFSLTDSLHNNIQPDITFDPYNFEFIVTYFDSTLRKLPYYTHDANLIMPNSWDLKSPGYNDDNNLAAPYPRVAFNFGNQCGMVAWINGDFGEPGAALYDAPYIFYTDVPLIVGNNLKVNVFPNPASDFLFLEFELQNTRNVEIRLTSILGQYFIIENQSYPAGKSQIKFDFTKYKPGTYIFKIQTNDSYSCKKIVISR